MYITSSSLYGLLHINFSIEIHVKIRYSSGTDIVRLLAFFYQEVFRNLSKVFHGFQNGIKNTKLVDQQPVDTIDKVYESFISVPLVFDKTGFRKQLDLLIYNMSLVTKKPVFAVFDQVRLKPVCLATETSYSLEILE